MLRVIPPSETMAQSLCVCVWVLEASSNYSGLEDEVRKGELQTAQAEMSDTGRLMQESAFCLWRQYGLRRPAAACEEHSTSGTASAAPETSARLSSSLGRGHPSRGQWLGSWVGEAMQLLLKKAPLSLNWFGSFS